jgi:hypothetical protein
LKLLRWRVDSAAARITVLGANGLVLTDQLVRLAGARARGIPEGAVDPHIAADSLATALSGLTVLVWEHRDLEDLAAALHTLGAPWPLPEGHVHELLPLTTAWRAEITPEGPQPRAAAPGRADRMLYLLEQIAHAGHQATRARRRPAQRRPSEPQPT